MSERKDGETVAAQLWRLRLITSNQFCADCASAGTYVRLRLFFIFYFFSELVFDFLSPSLLHPESRRIFVSPFFPVFFSHIPVLLLSSRASFSLLFVGSLSSLHTHTPGADLWGVSVTFGVFLCADCAEAHHACGDFFSHVKSFNDEWSKGLLQVLFSLFVARTLALVYPR